MKIIFLISSALVAVLTIGCIPPAGGGGGSGSTNTTPNPLDLDTDGIPDEFEMDGQTYLGMPLYLWGARQNQTDLFVEIDYLDSTNGGQLPLNEGVQPQEPALQKLVDAFALRGIALHFDVGDLFDQSGDNTLNPDRFDLGGGAQLAYVAQLELLNYPPTFRQFNMEAARESLFYYVLFAAKHVDENVLGQAYLNYPEALITLAQFTLDGESLALSTATDEETNFLINMQASTLMHELGHNFGLNHGGNKFDSVNFKPNYVSTMNYMYTFLGIPELGTNDEATPYYLWNRNVDNSPPSNDNFCIGAQFPDSFDDLAHSPYTSHFVVDYSDGSNDNINEFYVIEPLGIGTGSGISVDFNCNSSIESNIAFDINKDADNPGLTSLLDHDDWSNLNYYFAVNAPFQLSTLDNFQHQEEPIIVKEPPIPDRVVDRIRKRRKQKGK